MRPLHVEESGQGPPLVLWHGWGMNLRAFDLLRVDLARDHRVIAVDLPGHGRSSWNDTLDGDAQLHWLLQTVPEESVLIGWSLGGQFALRAAAAAPSRIRALVLLNSTPRFLRSPDWPHGLEPAVLQQFGERLQTDAARTVDEFLELEVRGSRAALSTLQELRGALQSHGIAEADALRAGLELLANHDLRTLGTALRQPALVVGGEYDRIVPPQATRALSAMLANAQYLELPRAGHAGLLSHAVPLLATLRGFLARFAPQAAAS